jgi:hypothetical protein
MKVHEMIKLLGTLDPEGEVIMSSDAEGNSYIPLSGWDIGYYNKNSLDWYSESWSMDDCDMDEEEYAELCKNSLSICLFPR